MRPIIALSLAALPASLAASTFHDLAAIDRQVAIFAGADIGQPGGAQMQVSRQLRLAQCSQPLSLEWQGADRLSVRVRCPDADSWRLFVPVMQGADRAAEQAPLIARRDALRVEAVGDGFRITRNGEALEEGRPGALIRVRIQDGTRQGRVISAQVVEAGRVRVPIS